MKRSKQTTFNLRVRLLALGALFVWLAGSEFCALEAVIGHTHEEARGGQVVENEPSDQHDSTPSQDSDGHDGREHSCCMSLQAAESVQPSVVFVEPVFCQVGALLPVWSALFSTPAERQEIFFRQPLRCQWVFTPEVCLGPAFRSHAPPVSFPI